MITKGSSWQIESHVEEMSLECIIVLSCKNFAGKCTRTDPKLLVAEPFILHDNARPHIAGVATKKFRDYEWEVLPHASYSPDMSPPAFDLFPKLKEHMCEWRFSSSEELSTDSTQAIRHMNKSGVLDGITMHLKHWDSVIEKQADYIEGLWT